MTKGLSNAGFDKDLAKAQKTEDSVTKLLLGDIKVEIKDDADAMRTGNVYVELECNGHPSGLRVTIAEWWAFKISPSVIILISKEELMRQVDISLEYGMVERGGDFDKTIGALVPMVRIVGRK